MRLHILPIWGSCAFPGFPPRISFADVLAPKVLTEFLVAIPYESSSFLVLPGNDPYLKLLLSEALATHLNATYLPFPANALGDNLIALCSTAARAVLYLQDAADFQTTVDVCRRFPGAPLIVSGTQASSCSKIRHSCVQVNGLNEEERQRFFDIVLAREPRTAAVTTDGIAEIAQKTSNYTVDQLHSLVQLTLRHNVDGAIAARHFIVETTAWRKSPILNTYDEYNAYLPEILQFSPIVWVAIAFGILAHFLTRLTAPKRRRNMARPPQWNLQNYGSTPLSAADPFSGEMGAMRMDPSLFILPEEVAGTGVDPGKPSAKTETTSANVVTGLRRRVMTGCRAAKEVAAEEEI